FADLLHFAGAFGSVQHLCAEDGGHDQAEHADAGHDRHHREIPTGQIQTAIGRCEGGVRHGTSVVYKYGRCLCIWATPQYACHAKCAIRHNTCDKSHPDSDICHTWASTASSTLEYRPKTLSSPVISKIFNSRACVHTMSRLPSSERTRFSAP